MQNNLVILEGPDHSGKSKLAFHLIEKYGFNYYHCGVKPDITQYHLKVLDMAYKDINLYNSNFVIDRLHLSEFVYGNIFRKGPKYDYLQLEQDIKNRFSKYRLIICLPPKEIVIDGHKKRLAKNSEMFNTVDKVYDLYKQLVDNKLVGYYLYDFTKDPNYEQLDKFLENKND